MLTPTLFPSLWRLSAVAAATVPRLNTVSDTAGQDTVAASAIPLPIIWVRCFFSAALLQETETETYPLKPILPFRRVVHRQLFTAQCAQSCSPTSLLPPSSSSHIYVAIIICRLPHHITYFLLYLLSHLSATSLILMSQSPRVSSDVYAARPYPPSLSSSMSDSAVLVNLRLPFHYYLPSSTPSCISASNIRIVLYLFRVSAIIVSVIPRLCRCCSPFLPPLPSWNANDRTNGMRHPRSLVEARIRNSK